jgi:chromosomal replication initiation ATPase DnaA
MLPHFLGGFNCTVFTYGQTGSGKTYTMFGAHAAQNPAKAKVGPKQKIKLRNRFSEAPPLLL